MSEQSNNENLPATFSFLLDGYKDATVDVLTRVVIEGAVNGGGVIVKATLNDDGCWTALIPKTIPEGSYDAVVEVVSNDRLTFPLKCRIKLNNHTVAVVTQPIHTTELTEAQFVNSGTSHVAGPEEPVDTKPQKPERPIENKLRYSPGQNNDEAIDHDALNSARTKEIASRVTSVQGPQLPFNDDNSVRDAIKKAIQSSFPVTRTKAEGKGKLFDAKTKHRLTRSPKYAAEAVEEEKREVEKQKRSRKVREVLGL